VRTPKKNRHEFPLLSRNRDVAADQSGQGGWCLQIYREDSNARGSKPWATHGHYFQVIALRIRGAVPAIAMDRIFSA
jgi:hypothetical protein